MNTETKASQATNPANNVMDDRLTKKPGTITRRRFTILATLGLVGGFKAVSDLLRPPTIQAADSSERGQETAPEIDEITLQGYGDLRTWTPEQRGPLLDAEKQKAKKYLSGINGTILRLDDPDLSNTWGLFVNEAKNPPESVRSKFYPSVFPPFEPKNKVGPGSSPIGYDIGPILSNPDRLVHALFVNTATTDKEENNPTNNSHPLFMWYFNWLRYKHYQQQIDSMNEQEYNRDAIVSGYQVLDKRFLVAADIFKTVVTKYISLKPRFEELELSNSSFYEELSLAFNATDLEWHKKVNEVAFGSKVSEDKLLTP